MNRKPEDRLERIVSDLLKGRRLRLRGGDAEEKEAITSAARLAGARQGPQRMHPAFRKQLAATLQETSTQGWITRRAALVAGLGLAAGAAGGTAFGRTFGVQTAKAGGEAIQPVNGRWVDVAALSDLAEGQGHHVTAGGVSAFVFRRGDAVNAVSAVCSHLPCDLWWDSRSANLNCPCHPASFTPEGKAVGGYALPSLSKVLVRVTDAGRVEVLGTE
ncbi:MAG TPA: Rieske (2Fe-2S) protein [Candidatus Dormibacteraeota bacterium]|nr:Rieske (2Fe-2S) protein [Candidatus Dormibacteraeota bacterium]